MRTRLSCMLAFSLLSNWNALAQVDAQGGEAIQDEGDWAGKLAALEAEVESLGPESGSSESLLLLGEQLLLMGRP